MYKNIEKLQRGNRIRKKSKFTGKRTCHVLKCKLKQLTDHQLSIVVINNVQLNAVTTTTTNIQEHITVY